MDASKLKDLAEAHCKGFAAVNKDPANKDIKSLAIAYASYFHSSDAVAFGAPGNVTYNSGAAQESNLTAWLENLVKFGIDPFKHISMKDLRVEVFSSRVALCWMTTTFSPPDREPFDCPLFYSYRVPLGEEKGDWDFMITDPQLEVIVEQYPDFFKTEGAPIDANGPQVLN